SDPNELWMEVDPVTGKNVFHLPQDENAYPDGDLRLWTKTGTSVRSPAPLERGGDYIEPDVTYRISSLPAANQIGPYRWRFYVEAVAPVLIQGGEQIQATIDPKIPDFPSILSDAVRVSTPGVKLRVDSLNTRFGELDPAD